MTSNPKIEPAARHVAHRLVLLLLLVMIPLPGCATFTYERTARPTCGGERRTGLRIGVARFSQPAGASLYPVWFSTTLSDPIGDLSGAVAAELRESGLFGEVVYLGFLPLDGPDLDYYRDVYRLDAILFGDVTCWYVTAVPPLWSLAPPFIALWPLHLLGLPTAPSRDSAALRVNLDLLGLAPGAGRWRSGGLEFSWHQHSWYSSLNIPVVERAVQTRAMDHFVTSLVEVLRREPSAADLAALGGRQEAAE